MFQLLVREPIIGTECFLYIMCVLLVENQLLVREPIIGTECFLYILCVLLAKNQLLVLKTGGTLYWYFAKPVDRLRLA